MHQLTEVKYQGGVSRFFSLFMSMRKSPVEESCNFNFNMLRIALRCVALRCVGVMGFMHWIGLAGSRMGSGGVGWHGMTWVRFCDVCV